MKETKKLEAMRSVYSYFFPEVRDIVKFGDLLPHELFMVSTSADEAQEIIDLLFRNPVRVTSTPEGKIDLDMIHEPVIDRIIQSYSKIAPGLQDFGFRYPTPGSSQGIFNELALLRKNGTDAIYTLRGEYEGYAEYARTLGISAMEIDASEDDIEDMEPGFWFISNPSAIDGNIIPGKFIRSLCDSGHKVALDLAYAGSTQPHEFDLSDENIPVAFLSLSKPYGVFRFRMGFTFSREPIDSLYANKWFKDVPRMLTAAKLVEEIPPGTLAERYRHVQKQIVGSINEDFGLGMKQSDAILLGHITGGDSQKLGDDEKDTIGCFRRGNGYRFCLTPYYEKEEMMKNGGK